MKRYRVSVCKGPTCKSNGSDAVFTAFKAAIQQAGIIQRCEVYRGGCYGLCHLGANVVVREDTGRPRDPFSKEDFQLMGWEGETYYAAMTPEKAQRITKEHLVDGHEVVELLGDASEPDPEG